MLLSRRFLLLGAALPLSGCFTPLYGEKITGQAVHKEFAKIEVMPISGRAGIQLRNDLIFAFSGNGEASENPFYRLIVNVTIQASLGVTDATAYRPLAESYLANAIFTLVEIDSKKEVIKGSASSSTSIDTSQQRYARDRGRLEATERAYKGVGDQIVSQLAAFFATR